MTIARIVARPIFWLIFLPRVRGREDLANFKNKPAIVAGNHIDSLDAATMGVLVPRNLHFLAKDELRRGKMGWLLKHLGLIFVDRDLDNDSIPKANKYLKNNMSIGIFPEGTCRKDFKKSNELLPFKYGAIKMAAETGAPIIPMAISGKYFLFSRLKVYFGEPIFVKKTDNLDKANEILRDAIADLLRKNKINVVKISGRPAKNPAKNRPIIDNAKTSNELIYISKNVENSVKSSNNKRRENV